MLGLLGAGLGLVGSLVSSNSQDRASRRAAEAAQFNPYNINMPRGQGGVRFGNNTATVNGGLLSDINQQFLNQTQRGQYEQGVYGNQFRNRAAQDIPKSFHGAQQANYVGGNQMAGLLGNRMFAQDAANAALQQYNTAGLNSINNFGGPGLVDPSSNFAMNQGMNLLGQDFQQTADNQLDLLRRQARPFEERQVNSRVQDMFNKGILGGTSGDRMMGELALSQENADIQRQIQSQGLAQNLFGMNQQAGRSLLGMGQSGMLQGRNQQINQAGMFGQFGLNALNQYTQGNQQAGQFGANVVDNITNRAQQRLSNAQGLFGFGDSAESNAMNRTMGNLNAGLGINTDMRNLIALGGNIGGTQAQAGANQANAIMAGGGSPVGSFLSGAGNGLLSGGGGWGGLFGNGGVGGPAVGGGGGFTGALTGNVVPDAWSMQNIMAGVGGQ